MNRAALIHALAALSDAERAEVYAEAIRLDFMRHMPAEEGADPRHRTVTAVCEAFGVTRSDLFSRSRRQRIAAARSCAYAVMVDLGMSTVAVGRYFKRDHSTVSRCARRIPAEFAMEEMRARVLVGLEMGDRT